MRTLLSILVVFALSGCGPPDPAPTTRPTSRPPAPRRKVTPPRKASPVVHYRLVKYRVLRFVARLGHPLQRTDLGPGLPAAAEPDGKSYAAMVRTAEECTDPSGDAKPCAGTGPCHKRQAKGGGDCVSAETWAVYGPKGKVIIKHRAVNHLPALATVGRRYVVWTLPASMAAGTSYSEILDLVKGRKFETGSGTRPRIQGDRVCYELAYQDVPPSERPKLWPRRHRCFDVRTWKERVITKPDSPRPK